MIMDFNLNVKFDATPALVGAVATLATAISGCGVMTPQVINPLPAKAPVQAPAAQQVEQVEQEAAAPVAEAPETVPEITSSKELKEIKDTDLRIVVSPAVSKFGKEKIFEILEQDFGITTKKVTSLPQDRRAEFIAKLNAL